MKRLYRSVTDKQVSGLCAGVAQWLGIDPTVVRLVAVVAVLFSFGTVVALYLLGSIIVPKEPTYGFGPNDQFSSY
ncbi:phage shock protein PspC (stress-responsive transcriptional regulator) [Paenibacillus anaericanus]|uniref:PspC domain-containing protein n=1 Tax=Paenibacillus anaericanus TaxID=170367 RepID=A0A3S1CBM9_9BACL|nr:PspC domain-containing protein [Paenibacillus anaericanus]MDQ0089364.1 phage shock protein PspC (stress-responsive transcriptional regulator) [Paenibacillus anaericanus]RUT48390.1 PspC domain-containing protein [Paenibacillus anaericanus]